MYAWCVQDYNCVSLSQPAISYVNWVGSIELCGQLA